jgi:hypothetical protein
VETKSLSWENQNSNIYIKKTAKEYNNEEEE